MTAEQAEKETGLNFRDKPVSFTSTKSKEHPSLT